jgi:hypothetical protein
MLRQTSLGTLGLCIGGILTITGFVAYGTGNATLNLVGFFYGIPLLLGGLPQSIRIKADTLQSAHKSFGTETTRATSDYYPKANSQDVMRYRYGQKAHLDSSLESLRLSPTDEERTSACQPYEKQKLMVLIL